MRFILLPCCSPVVITLLFLLLSAAPSYWHANPLVNSKWPPVFVEIAISSVFVSEQTCLSQSGVCVCAHKKCCISFFIESFCCWGITHLLFAGICPFQSPIKPSAAASVQFNMLSCRGHAVCGFHCVIKTTTAQTAVKSGENKAVKSVFTQAAPELLAATMCSNYKHRRAALHLADFMWELLQQNVHLCSHCSHPAAGNQTHLFIYYKWHQLTR